MSRATAHLELLVVVAVMDDHEAKVKALAEVKEVVGLCLGPGVVMEVELVFLL